jgi:hypothetical protein
MAVLISLPGGLTVKIIDHASSPVQKFCLDNREDFQYSFVGSRSISGLLCLKFYEFELSINRGVTILLDISV